MSHEIVFFENGSATLKDIEAGEVMHSKIGPWQEANLLYVEQSRLEKRLSEPHAAPLTIYDVGMGLATNAIAALECWQRTPQARPLRIVSFENDLGGLETALNRIDLFPFLAPHSSLVRTLLDNREAQLNGGGFFWELIPGSYPETLGAARVQPDLVFYDFYSPKTLPALWDAACLSQLRARCQSTVLLTYAASTAFRAALFEAGFFVGKGSRTEAKKDTTVAATHLADLEHPLDRSWIEKLGRSSVVLTEDQRRKILASGQFE